MGLVGTCLDLYFFFGSRDFPFDFKTRPWFAHPLGPFLFQHSYLFLKSKFRKRKRGTHFDRIERSTKLLELVFSLSLHLTLIINVFCLSFNVKHAFISCKLTQHQVNDPHLASFPFNFLWVKIINQYFEYIQKNYVCKRQL